MQLTAEQIQDNFNLLLNYINKYIESPSRKAKLLVFYTKHADRLMLLPASHKKEYYNAFPGGYIEHVLRVIRCSEMQYNIWKEEGVDITTFTLEELIFSALNHDLGKLGDEEEDSYLQQTDSWRRDKLGEDYMFNTKLPFAPVADRSLYLLQSNDISYTFNEMLAIQTHNGLYDDSNRKYLVGHMVEQKPRTALPFILHQAYQMAIRIEFEREWLPKFNSSPKPTPTKPSTVYPTKNKKDKALSSVKSQSLKDILNDL